MLIYLKNPFKAIKNIPKILPQNESIFKNSKTVPSDIIPTQAYIKNISRFKIWDNKTYTDSNTILQTSIASHDIFFFQLLRVLKKIKTHRYHQVL